MNMTLEEKLSERAGEITWALMNAFERVPASNVTLMFIRQQLLVEFKEEVKDISVQYDHNTLELIVEVEYP